MGGMGSGNNFEDNILVVSENGYGKRSDIEDYRITNRGGKGVKTISITDKTGGLVAIKNVTDSDDLMIINKSGIAIRLSVEDFRVINLKGKDSIAAVAKVMKDEDAVEDVDVMDIEVKSEDGTAIDNKTDENGSDEASNPDNE